MADRPNPLGRARRDLTEYPSVRFAVRAWAIYQTVGAVVAGIVVLVFVLVGIQAVSRLPPPPPPRPRVLILRENSHLVPRRPDASPVARFSQGQPPPKGYAFEEITYTPVKLPPGLPKAPPGWTYSTAFTRVPIPPDWKGILVTSTDWQPSPPAAGDSLEVRWFKRRPLPDGYGYDEQWRLVKLPRPGPEGGRGGGRALR